MAAALLPEPLWDLVEPFFHEAFLSLECALICWQCLRKTWTAAKNRRPPSRPSFANKTPSLWKSRPCRCLTACAGQAPGIGLHYAVDLY